MQAIYIYLNLFIYHLSGITIYCCAEMCDVPCITIDNLRKAKREECNKMSRGCNEKKRTNKAICTSLVAIIKDFKKSYTWHTEPKVIHVFETTLGFELWGDLKQLCRSYNNNTTCSDKNECVLHRFIKLANELF